MDGECVLPFSRGAAVAININGLEFRKFRNRRTDLFLWPSLNCHVVLEMCTNCPVCLPTWGPDWTRADPDDVQKPVHVAKAHRAININDQDDHACSLLTVFFSVYNPIDQCCPQHLPTLLSHYVQNPYFAD